ncbi:carboxypeptidase-like regulatory domain-containing protein [Limibacter armeniacum]|uniref:TonB-dependent receptor n=1 Tax=Limibacter armeniacum TaxID=466084 RepID=UPI002FE63A55
MHQLSTIHFRTLIFNVCLFISIPTIGQTITGKVMELKSKNGLEGAFISVPAYGLMTVSETDGSFSLELEGKPVSEVIVSMLGYDKMSMVLSGNNPLEVYLKPLDTTLEEVEIVEDAGLYNIKTLQSVTISAEELSKIPTFLGEVDVVKNLKMQAGIGGTTEMDGGYYVRGSSYTHNTVLIDGMPLFNLSHLMGVSSMIQGDIIDEVSMYKSAYPVEYNGALASYLVVNTKAGNTERHKVKSGIGLLSSSMKLDGPIVKGKSSYSLALRKNYYDVVTSLYDEINKGKEDYSPIPLYTFWDGSLRLDTELKGGHHLSLTGFHSSDILIRDREDRQFVLKSGWKNHLASLNWSYRDDAGVNYQAVAGVSSFNYTSYLNYGTKETGNNGVLQWHFRYQADGWLGEKWHLMVGNSLSWLNFDIKNHVITTDGETIRYQRQQTAPSQLAAFADINYHVNSDLKVRLANRVDIFVNGKTRTEFSPGVDMTYKKKKWTYDMGISRSVQFHHMLSVLGFSLPADVMYPANEVIKPQSAWQASTGLKRELGKGISIKGATFYKWLYNLSELKDGANVSTETAEEVLLFGNGNAYGAEATLSKEDGKFTGELNYTYTRIRQQFEDINNGNSYSPYYDIPHRFNINVHYQFTEKLSVMSAWAYSSGALMTVPVSLVAYQGTHGSGFNGPVPIYDSRNNFRMPENHRLDFGLEYWWSGKYGKSTISFGVFNAYNRANPFYVYFDGKENENGSVDIVAKKKSLMPLMPSIGYSFELY